VLQIQNVGDFDQNDSDLQSAAIGRQSKAGVRLRF
jgi:hypothetical protein